MGEVCLLLLLATPLLASANPNTPRLHTRASGTSTLDLPGTHAEIGATCAELVQAMEGHMPEGAKHIKLQDALQFSVAAGPRSPIYRAFMPYPLAKLITGTTLIVDAMGTTHAFLATLTDVRLPPVQDAGRENSKFWATLDLTPDYILSESHLVAPISLALSDAGFTLIRLKSLDVDGDTASRRASSTSSSSRT
jgi:hypothetical protein